MTATTEKPTEAEWRVARRRELREQLAAIDLIRVRLAEIEALLHACDIRVDEATAQHQRVTEPLQAERAEIEQSIVKAMAAKNEIRPQWQSRRKEILRGIEQANRTLEAAIESEREPRKRLQAEFDELRMKTTNYGAIENDLLREPAAEPKDLLTLFANNSAVRWASERYAAAAAKVRHWQSALEAAVARRETDNEKTYRLYLSQWTAESQSAGEALGLARDAQEALVREMKSK